MQTHTVLFLTFIVADYSSSNRISRIWQAAFATGVPGPKMAGYGFRHSEDISGAERYRRLCAFLDANPFITRKDYSGITGLLKNKALNDLNLLVEKGILTTLGQGSHKVYVRAVNQCVAE